MGSGGIGDRHRVVLIKIGLGSTGVASGVTDIKLVDTWKGIGATIELDRPALLWRHPVHTVSLSEGGF